MTPALILPSLDLAATAKSRPYFLDTHGNAAPSIVSFSFGNVS